MKRIIVDIGFKENRVALLDENDLVELYIEKEDDRKISGNIYKGRIINVLPGMECAFVDIGEKKNAFLYVKDAIPRDVLLDNSIDIKNISIKDVVKVGQELIVQVIKEPHGTKGAKITTHLTLPGRNLVLMPYTNYLGISRRITSVLERERLKAIADEIKPDNVGIILRTAARGKEAEDLRTDIKFLLKLYSKIDRERNLGFAPRTIYRDLDLVHRTVRDLFTNDFDQLIVNDIETYNSILELVEFVSPHLLDRVNLFDGSHDIFGYYGIESKINNALAKKVWLKSGGYIIIDETEALTSIDVNTGKYVGKLNLEDTILKTNIEAAKEIAKQLRLRNIGGIIIIDFIDMNVPDDEKQVIKILENELLKDRTKASVLGITRLGLVEMTRKKVRSRLSSKLLKTCPCCEGRGTVYSEDFVLNILRKELQRTRLHTNAQAILIDVNPSINDLLIKNNNSLLNELEKRYDIKVFINSNEKIMIEEIKIRRIGKIKDIEKYIQDI